MEEAYVIAQNTAGAASTSALPFAAASTAVDAETLLLTTQGDGIHLTAVEDSTPLSSLTLGPSTRFATPAVARRRPNSNECDICVGMQHQPEIWHWRAEMKADSTFVGEPEKRVKKIEKSLIALAALDNTSTAAFATLSSTGAVSVLDDAFNELAKLSEEQSNTTSTLSGRLEAFRSAGSSSLMLAVTRFRAFAKNVPASGKKNKPRKSKPQTEEFARAASLQIVSYEGEAIRNVANVVFSESDIIDLSYSHEARLISVLCASGIWQTYTLSPSNELVPLRQLALSSSYITFNKPEPSQARPGHLLALNDSFVLLAASQKSVAEKASLSIWDLRFGVPVRVSEVNLTAKFDDICLSNISPALAIITHKTSTHTRAYGLPLTLPASSTLSLVVGKQASAIPFLVGKDPADQAADEERKRKLGMHPLSSEAKQVLLAEAATSRQTLLTTIKTSDSSLDVDDLVEEWIIKETARKEAYLRAKDDIRAEARKARDERKKILLHEPTATNRTKIPKSSMKWKPPEGLGNDAIRAPTVAAGLADLELSDDEKERPSERAGQNRAVEESTESEAERTDTAPKQRSTERFSISLDTVKPTLPVNFVSRLLTLCLDDARKEKRPIKTLRYLLERRVVSDHAIPGGVTMALQKAQLWPLVSIALKVIVNIPEEVVINLLGQTAHAPSQDSLPHEQRISKFPPFLSKVVDYPMSSKELRRALASNLNLTDTRRIVHLLQVWVEFWNDPSLEYKYYVPELPNILVFLAALVDSHFVNLLQDRTAYRGLQQLALRLNTAIETNEDLLLLKGPLDNVRREHYKLNRPKTDAELARRRLEEERSIGAYSLDVFEV